MVFQQHSFVERECMQNQPPVERINGKCITAFMLRTSINIHGDEVAELVTEYIGAESKKGNRIEIELNA